ncbi:hypothetical protein OH491_13590 [Termitidicoccus mucosus]|uniref:ArsR family transcriptional regulator n=1 Tax=Termitidicoccus mucosus TaxID=1184151 RepID=A0A178IH54_9BACT|nr:hypothetical protein AW736_13860 [Opitutaceae bacterium TSB47]
MSPAVLRTTILAELAGAPHGTLTQEGLLTCVCQRLPGTTLADLRQELSWLRDRRLADYVPAPLDDDARTWTITTTGRAALKQ